MSSSGLHKKKTDLHYRLKLVRMGTVHVEIPEKPKPAPKPAPKNQLKQIKNLCELKAS